MSRTARLLPGVRNVLLALVIGLRCLGIWVEDKDILVYGKDNKDVWVQGEELRCLGA